MIVTHQSDDLLSKNLVYGDTDGLGTIGHYGLHAAHMILSDPAQNVHRGTSVLARRDAHTNRTVVLRESLGQPTIATRKSSTLKLCVKSTRMSLSEGSFRMRSIKA